MERLDAAKRLPENQGPIQQFAIEQIAHLFTSAGIKDPGPKVEPTLKTTEAPIEIKTLSKDQLILPETSLPQEVSEVLQRAENAGIGVFDAHHLSDVTLTKDLNVEGWNKKPNSWYWDQIAKGNINQDAPKLPGSWVLIDRTQRPDYKGGKQLHENDPFGPLLAKLREDNKIEKIKGIPETSRFGISPDELTQVVLPEIAKLLGVEVSAVRLPKAIEFNVIGNLKHPEWGNTNTWEWFADKFGGGRRLVGGYSGAGGLTYVSHDWSGVRYGRFGFSSSGSSLSQSLIPWYLFPWN